jgi:hypothetical protein
MTLTPATGDSYEAFMVSLGSLGSPFAAGRLEAFRVPFNGHMMRIPHWAVDVASSSGGLEFDIELNGTTIFTTTPTIDATEEDSDDATPAVFDGVIEFARGDLFEVHCLDDGAGDAEGPKVTLFWVSMI